MPVWGTRAERETKRRIFLCMCALAYEKMNASLTDDHNFDAECLLVDLTLDTGSTYWDTWWRTHFVPCTGMWIHQHPNLDGLEALVTEFLEGKGRFADA